MSLNQPVLHRASRIGIVNRGEPAMRFIRAVREYNEANNASLATVAFYLDEESESLFVREADDALAFRTIPGATQAGSVYLDHEVLLEGLRRANCDAVWAGWGFVSEDADFARMIADDNRVFLGPDHEAMALLGDKIAAKDLAERSGVPILPWSKREIGDLDDARTIAEQIGYPVIVKAAHAGGGRGIRFVMTEDELETQLTSAREETLRITGDEIVFIERLVQTGKHLEVQCITDREGNVFTFGVRDCSVQRRNQKIIEETPPPGVNTDEIAEIEAAASRLMKAAGYESAGTVEFLYDLDRNEFYFMEVNTRLQVEHPITEILYGVDLVKGQIDVAFGKTLEFPGASPKGVVLEARLNAEDPDRDFTPAPGYVRYFRTPAGPGIRVDSGIEQGSTIPSLFDSMVAKVIARGTDRADAIARLRRALRETRIGIDGGTTNKAFLLSLLSQEELIAGGVHTKWVEAKLASEGALKSAAPDASQAAPALIAAGIEAYLAHQNADLTVFRRQISNFGYPRSSQPGDQFGVVFGLAGNAYEFVVRQVSAHHFVLTIDDQPVLATYRGGQGESRLHYAGSRYSIQSIERGDALQIEVDGFPVLLEQESGGAVKAPSPAVVLGIAAGVGTRVEKGDRLLSLEAMKMEMIIDAPSAGIVREILITPGQQVAAGESLMQLEPIAEEGDESDSSSEAEASPRVSFVGAGSDAEASWDLLTQSFRSLFTGYDASASPAGDFSALVKLAEEQSDFRERLFYLIYELLDRAVTIDTLFSSERTTTERFARPVSWQELVYIYFRYAMQDNDALPAGFVEVLDQALAYYPHAIGTEASWLAFFHLQRTQRVRDKRLELIRTMIFTLEGLPVPHGRSEGLLRLLDSTIRLHQIGMHSLADAALHARYHLYEQRRVNTVRHNRSQRIQQTIARLLSLPQGSEDRETLEQGLIDASAYIERELLAAFVSAEPAHRPVIAALLARHVVRDRELESVGDAIEPSEGIAALTVRAGGVDTVLVLAADAAPIQAGELGSFVERVGADDPELVVLTRSTDDPEALFSVIASTPLPVARLSIGIYGDNGEPAFRTYEDNDGWHEDERRRHFTPLFYRELRVDRMGDFDIKVMYRSESVYLVSLTARNNSRDIRLFALASASESVPEIGTDGQIDRVSEFDDVFMEAVFKIRAEQARRPRRLFWNRIVVHVRALIPLSAAQMKEYGNRIVPRTQDLGLEKVVVYTRRKRWSEDVVRDLELMFLNISEDQFTLRSRKPSTEPYKPMDQYVSSVVRSRQRNNVYPYEVVKMITYTGYPVSLNVPRGDFEEYDIKVADSGDQELTSAKGRAYGHNDSNIVFGVVRNQDPQSGLAFKRVLILSDATKDMGSLAEAECRRIIAALDLADEHHIPVEWIPISSGARIDMDSGTENLDWTAAVLRRIIEFTQNGGEINIIVSGINVGAQSYWNAEATMLMHTRGLLIMTDEASMLLTGKKALDFSGSVSADSNVDIGGVERIMGPNGQAQIWAGNLAEAYGILFQHYRYCYVQPGKALPDPVETTDPADRDVSTTPYDDRLGQGFSTIGDIFSIELNPERKKPFDMRQLMSAVIDQDAGYLERWAVMMDAETAVTWETRIAGMGVGLVGIESRPLARLGDVPHDGPESWSGGTLFPQSSRKVARAINAWSDRLPVVVLANLSGFDGSPESLRRLQLEYGAEIGRAVVNFKGPIVFVVVARYHGGAYVVFSKSLNPKLQAFALEGSYASVLGGAPAAAVVFPRQVQKETQADERYKAALEKLEAGSSSQREFDDVYRTVQSEKQAELATRFDNVHDIKRARTVGSIDEIISVADLRPAIARAIAPE